MKKGEENLNRAELYNPTLTDAHRSKERMVILDPEKGPENKKKKK